MAATPFVFEGSVRNGAWLANVMESASRCIEIVRVAFGPQGIFIRAMPASQELMIDVRVKRAAFKSLHVSGAITFELGLNVVQLAKILKTFRLRGTDAVELRVNHGQTRLSMRVDDGHCCKHFDLRALSLQFMANAPPSECHNAAVQIAWIFDLNEDCAPMRFHCDMGQIGEIVVYVVPQSR